MDEQFGDVHVSDAGGHVALVEIQRGPNNFFDEALIASLVAAFTAVDESSGFRASVLASQGRHFCAGANFSSPDRSAGGDDRRAEDGNPLYTRAVQLFRNQKYVVGAIQGAAVGGGFGLALFPDFRVGCPQARFTANFVKLGFTPGFGLTRVLPRLIGEQHANELFATGRRIDGETAAQLGIIDRLAADADTVRDDAVAFAQEIAENAPLALLSLRKQMRGDLADIVQAATDVEGFEQFHLQRTADFREGIKAVAERRPGNFRAE